jgi:hypothetical protein
MTLPHEGPAAGARVLELFGPSSGGKSSLAAKLLAERPGLATVEARLLARAGLGWLPAGRPRVFALHALAALGVLATWREGRAFYRFAAAEALRGAWPGSRRLRLHLLRNSWKTAALRLLARRAGAPGETLLMDEGPLQIANYLLVHSAVPPDVEALAAFLRVVPLPDAAAYVRAGEDELVARTLARTHPRIRDGSRAATVRFVAHALAVFDRIAADPRIRERLVAPETLPAAPREACA